MWLTEAGCEERRSRCDSPRLLFLSLAGRSLVKKYTLRMTGVGVLSRQNEPVKLQALGLAAGRQRRLDDALGLDISIAARPVHALLQQRNVDVLEIHRARVALSAEHVARDVGGAGKVTEAANLPQSEAFGRTRRLSAVQLT